MSKKSDYVDKRRSSSGDIFVFSVTILDAYENELPESNQIDIRHVLQGSQVNVTKNNGARRNATLLLDNSEGIYTPNPDGLIWLNNKILIKTGIYVDGEINDYNQGIFVISEVNESSSQSSKTIEYKLLDKFSLIDGTIAGTLENDIVIPTGSANLVDAIDYLFTLADSQNYLINYSNKPLIADPIAYTIPFTATESEGNNFFSLMNTILKAQGLDIYFDRDGFPRLEQETDLDNDPPLYTFEENDKLKISINKRIDFTKIKNRGRVEGINFSNGITADASGSITDSFNPLRVSLIGGRQFYEYADGITSDSEASIYLNYLLNQTQKVPETANTSFLNLDFLDVGDIVVVNESSLGLLNSRYLVRQLNIPLFQTSSTMTSDIERTVSYLEE